MSDWITSLSGPILITAPHQDDGVLGCGGTLAAMADTSAVTVAYACDGGCPPGGGQVRFDEARKAQQSALRRAEALDALSELGLKREQVRFLNFPDWELANVKVELGQRLERLISEIDPALIFTPFRYDRHDDHVVLSRAVRGMATTRQIPTLEYFIYPHWKLLPGGDVRELVHPKWVRHTELAPVATQKMRALRQFVSQTTCYYEWQRKPVLSTEVLESFCSGRECFLEAPVGVSERSLFTILPMWIRQAGKIEPRLKWAFDKMMRRY